MNIIKTIHGFTLLETLVAVSVLLMALLGPFAIASQSLRSAFYARDQVTAFYLAQEGIEYVRAVRDQNYLAGAPDWLAGSGGSTDITVCSGAAIACTVDFKTFTHAQCPGGSCPALYIDTAGLYTQTPTVTQSKFTRAVNLTDVAGEPKQKIVSVTVSWKSIGINRTFTITERIFNWL